MPIIKCDIQTLVSRDHHCHHYVACGPPAHCGSHAFLLPNLLTPTPPLLELVQFVFLLAVKTLLDFPRVAWFPVSLGAESQLLAEGGSRLPAIGQL